MIVDKSYEVALAERYKKGAALDERKVGKLPMHLVVDGFPLLKRELARMMQWAAEVKGYLPHDWKKMSVGEFKAAQHRHESKRLLDGPLDDESNLMHLVHEAFNAMAAAEVALMDREKGNE
ncbi:hypothetical protein C5022_000034 [Pseudomonas phage vB_PaeP_130_113]|uniref:dATP/dGTP diphosphohydrolase N-terminal domain-containing protein n=1 Tax=Pseudomonas phage vB_PaeP_130_113 TaxID=2161784 RepID=A0A2R4P9C4_9CAUD|nr:dATP / dGTP pyrophosphohydrolase [Pseudomonas phage vB_PaeP_130_113]AVX47637.1 hypothetical protein C5022_000034 [Pseudomonas phage vB_PaeP_130_113]